MMSGFVHNVYRKATINLGDRCCAPMLYYKFSGRDYALNEIMSWSDKLFMRGSSLILGGGGIFNPVNIPRIRNVLCSRFKTKVLWGCGMNGADYGESIDIIRSFDLAGMRDSGWPNVVPCASCKSTLFDNPVAASRDIVLYEYHVKAVPVFGFPRMNTAARTMKEVIDFLSSGETVITNSYHGAYWATLLGRKVVVFRRESGKMTSMVHQPVVTDPGSWREAVKKAVSFPDALHWCRWKNDLFFDRVGEILCAS